MTSVMRRETQSAPSGFANSRNPASPTPSAQRTGAPTALSRSSNTTSSAGAACFACQAATAPAGPAPTTRRSTSGIGDHGECADRAGSDAFLAAGAGCVVDGQDVQLEVDRFRGAQGQTQATTVTHREVNDGNCVRGHATHGRKASRAEKARQASSLLGVTHFITLSAFA